MKRSWLIVLVSALGLPLGALSEEETTSFAEAFEGFYGLVEDGEVEAAEALAEPWLVDESILERERAGLRFGLGLVRGRSEEHAHWDRAVDHFSSARALSGPGAARLDATYDAGVVQMQEGERQRALLPEIGGGADPSLVVPPGMPAPGAPGVPGVPGVPGAPGTDPEQEQEDPLVLAREAFEQARSTLSERLRADWRDVDTRANLELIQRRLAELDEIERQREEQEQQQQEQQDGEGEEGEPQDGENEGEKEPSQEDQEGQDGEPNEQDGEPPEEGEQGEQEEQQEDEGPGELEPPSEAEAAQEGEEQPGEEAERHLTKEEVMRLLDRLAELEEQGRQVEAQLQRASRQSVERDW